MAESHSLRQRFQGERHPAAPPPSYDECVGSTDPEVLPLSHDEARKALLRFVNKRWFADKSPAIEFDFVNIQSSPAYRYQLETFTESRSVSWAHEPFTGQFLDSPQLGQEPEKWTIEVSPPVMFVEGERKVEVAHTASQETCHKCHGATNSQCWMCQGSGGIQCAPCRGCGQVPKATPSRPDNIPNRATCGLCNGSGAERCSTCSGRGQIKCETCSGAGRLKKFKELTVTWHVHRVDRIVELTGLDHDCVRKAQARTLMQEESLQAEPIRDFPIPCMRVASEELVDSHSSAFPNSKRLMQRQSVFLVPVHKVTAEWKTGQFCYWVYGYDNSAHCTEYPGNKCKCDCTVF